MTIAIILRHSNTGNLIFSGYYNTGNFEIVVISKAGNYIF